MRRLFWFSLGAATGYYAARRGERFVEEARDRGLVGNVTVAAGAASRLAHNASRTVAVMAERAGTPADDHARDTVDLTATTPPEGRH